ncbi:MAG: transposase family protein [Deinococcales bacterium]
MPYLSQEQRKHYSGKKRHTVKNIVIATLKKLIIFVGLSFSGHNHDYKMLKQEFPPEQEWFEAIESLADLGYQGICKDYKGENIRVPHKKPRKSKSNPEACLSDEKKAESQALGKLRVLIENAIYSPFSQPQGFFQG